MEHGRANDNVPRERFRLQGTPDSGSSFGDPAQADQKMRRRLGHLTAESVHVSRPSRKEHEEMLNMKAARTVKRMKEHKETLKRHEEMLKKLDSIAAPHNKTGDVEIILAEPPKYSKFEMIVRCPNFKASGRDFGCDPKNGHAAIAKGARIVIFGTSLTLDQPGEWFYDKSDQRLYYYPFENTGFPYGSSNQVVIPVLTTLVEVGEAPTPRPEDENRNLTSIRSLSKKKSTANVPRKQVPPRLQDIVFEQFAFLDLDYTAATPEKAQGFQAPFLAYGSRHGIPSDAAIRIRNADRVAVRGCEFLKLGGGGVHVTDASKQVCSSAEVGAGRDEGAGVEGVRAGYFEKLHDFVI